MKTKLLSLIVLLIVVGVFFSFFYDQDDTVRTTSKAEGLSYNMDPSKEITHTTSGTIRSDGLIAVRFKDGQVSLDNLKQEITGNNIFWFEPSLEGRVYWSDERTIVFEPSTPLQDKNSYTGVVDLKELFPDIHNLEPEKKVFAFRTEGQEIINIEGGFNPSDRDKVIFSGDLELSQKSETENVKRALILMNDNQKQRYMLNVKTSDNLKFSFTSVQFARKGDEQKFIFKVDKEKLGLSADFSREYTVAPSDVLTVCRIEENRDKNVSSIRVIFSDPLDPELNYTGFINLQPVVNFNTEVDGRLLIIRGDFLPGEKYMLRLLAGFRGSSGKYLNNDQDYQVELEISNNYPKLEFVNPGIYLTSTCDKKIAFRTMNLARVHLKVKKVKDDNLITFFEENSYRVNSDSYYKYSRYGFKRTGEIIESEVLELGNEMNKWIRSEIDLSNVIVDDSSALYIIQLEYAEDDALYFPEKWDLWKIRNYVRNSGQISKHIILSDLGITAKKCSDKTHVFVTDILKAVPVKEVAVTLKDKKGKIVDTAYTDSDGMCILKKGGSYLEVRKKFQYAILKFSESGLDTSLFNVGGIKSKNGLKAFIYTDRGVYRPGDKLNISVIARNEKDTFPKNHPVTLKLFNPRNKLIHEETKRVSSDGFFSFAYDSNDAALTGNWRAVFKIGNQSFTRIIKIETIVPYRIEVEIESDKESLTLEDTNVNFDVSARYLFGSPAAGLETVSSVCVEPYEMYFDRYNGFTFNNQSIDFKVEKSHDFKQRLDEEGQTEINWNLPQISTIPSAVRVRINTRVIEKGGRPVPAVKYLPLECYDRYVGIKKLKENWLEIGNKAHFDIVLVSKDGLPIAGEKLRYRIYRLRRYWWWDYDSSSSFRRHYKTSSLTELVKEGIVTSGEGVTSLEYKLNDYGEMLIEVEDINGGHTAGYFFRSYWWGDEETTKSADIINIRTDKDKYYIGETAKVLVNAPEKGRALLTVEKAGKILYRKWYDLDSSSTEFELEVREEYVPNVYISIAILQPYLQKENDLPIRMFGIVPLMVERKDSRLEFEVDSPETIRPGDEFKIKIDSEKPAQFTVAVVDEGLLDITGFKTPDPWKYFFSKEKLMTEYYDTFSDIIGLSHGYTYNVFSPGGDRSEDDKYREKQLQRDTTKRFKPVALFKGPLTTDENGKAVVTFTMPEYIGRVRVMVVGADGGTYGCKEKDITVKSPLMIMPTLPRVLGPEDVFEVPVTVFVMEENLGDVKISIKTEGPLKIVGENEINLQFKNKATRDIFFKLAAEPAIGTAKIKISASSAEEEAEYNTEINVRPYNLYTYLAETRIIGEEKSAVFQVPPEGIKNAASARLSVSWRKNLRLNHRLKWLIRYPYGCIEQTVSSVFPQLYLSDLYQLSHKDKRDIDKNINAAIKKLRAFQLNSGGFSYWPDGNSPTQWGTNYAGHFLMEADSRGYSVPDDVLQKWEKYELNMAKGTTDRYYLTGAYRLYLLNLAGKKPLNAMNYLRESRFDEMGNTARYYLAAAYQLAGYEETADEILSGLDTEVEEDEEYWWFSYGSNLRNRAIMLEISTLLNDYERALGLYNVIAEMISSDNWYSTQTTAYSLLAMGKYLQAVSKIDEDITGRIVLPDESEQHFEVGNRITKVSLKNCFAKDIIVFNDAKQPIYVTLEWEGLPLSDMIKTEANNLTLSVQWYDDGGNLLDPSQIVQGVPFWGVYTIEKDRYRQINEMALVQILPSGWEIENLRLHETELPEWLSKFRISKPEYLDIRDDRIMWFFDFNMYYEKSCFVVKLNAVTAGDFYLPPTVVEAMYDNNYKAVLEGKEVQVIRKKQEDSQ